MPPTESFDILVQPSLNSHHKFIRDSIILKQLNVTSLRLITNLLGQSVALNAYESLVEEALKRFSTMNNTIQKQGKINRMDKE